MKFKNIFILICFFCISLTLVSGEEEEESEPVVIDVPQQLHVGDVPDVSDVTETDEESQIVTLEGKFCHLC